jgi:hypothetical protein
MKFLNWMLFLMLALIVPIALAYVGHERWAIGIALAVVMGVLWRMFGPAIELEIHKKSVDHEGKVSRTATRKYRFNDED